MARLTYNEHQFLPDRDSTGIEWTYETRNFGDIFYGKIDGELRFRIVSEKVNNRICGHTLKEIVEKLHNNGTDVIAKDVFIKYFSESDARIEFMPYGNKISKDDKYCAVRECQKLAEEMFEEIFIGI